MRIIRELIDFKPKHSNTNIAEALRFFTNAIKKRSIAFLISDFEDQGFDKALEVASRKHDVVALRVYDEREDQLPNIGLVEAKDPETGEITWIDTSNSQIRERYANMRKHHQRYLRDVFTRCGIDNISIHTAQDYVPPLIRLFQIRERRK